jgi:hypothetical protein
VREQSVFVGSRRRRKRICAKSLTGWRGICVLRRQRGGGFVSEAVNGGRGAELQDTALVLGSGGGFVLEGGLC